MLSDATLTLRCRKVGSISLSRKRLITFIYFTCEICRQVQMFTVSQSKQCQSEMCGTPGFFWRLFLYSGTSNSYESLNRHEPVGKPQGSV